MKRIINLLICALLLGAVPAGAQQIWTLSTTMTATLDGKGVLTIKTTKKGGEAMPDYGGYADSPWSSVAGKVFSAVVEPGVTDIGNYTFLYCNNLTSVTLPDSLARIGGYAFYGCSSLPSLIIPVGTTAIGGDAFYGCTSLASLTVHSTAISGGAFSGTSINSVTFGSTVKHIGENAFNGCPNLVSVTIPNSVEIIDNGAFFNCTSLVSATIGDSVATIGQDAFSQTSLTSIEIPWSVANIGTTPFRNCGSLAAVTVRSPSINNAFSGLGITSLTLGDSVKTLGVNAFSNCGKLTTVTFGKELVTIGSNAFSNCTALTSIAIPSPVKTVGASAFQSCTHLATVGIPSSVTEIGAGAFSGCKELTKVSVEWTAPLAISAGTFANINLQAVTLRVPSGTEALYRAAPVWKDFGYIEEPAQEWNLTPTMTATLDKNGLFTVRTAKAGGEAMPDFTSAFLTPWKDDLSSITSVVLEEGVTSIGEHSFWCEHLTSVTLPSSLTRIGSNAFFACGNLTSVPTLPASVTHIGTSAFALCRTLAALEVDAANPAYASEDGVLYSKDLDTLHTCPAGRSGTFTIPTSVRIIGNGAFHGCSNLSGVELHGKITAIEPNAFRYCEMPLIQIPASVTSIGYDAFEFSGTLENIHVDAGNTTYTSVDGVLYSKDLTVLLRYPAGKTQPLFDIPSTVTRIGGAAFCEAPLTSVTIPSSVEILGGYIFEYCRNLTSVTIPASVKEESWGLFTACENLKDVHVYWETPFAIAENTFQFIDRSAATLHVPAGTEALYRAAPVWKDFGHIEARQSTGLDPAASHSLQAHAAGGSLYISATVPHTLYIYTLSGTLAKRLTVGAGQTASVALPKGLYIVKAGRETRIVNNR
jgi:hypothetical protein